MHYLCRYREPRFGLTSPFFCPSGLWHHSKDRQGLLLAGGSCSVGSGTATIAATIGPWKFDDASCTDWQQCWHPANTGRFLHGFPKYTGEPWAMVHGHHSPRTEMVLVTCIMKVHWYLGSFYTPHKNDSENYCNGGSHTFGSTSLGIVQTFVHIRGLCTFVLGGLMWMVQGVKSSGVSCGTSAFA